MAIHRRFTASCDVCEIPFVGDGSGYARVVAGVAEFSDELRKAMKQHGWTVNNKIVCPTCRDAMALHAISINQATTKEQ